MTWDDPVTDATYLTPGGIPLFRSLIDQPWISFRKKTNAPARRFCSVGHALPP